MAREVVWTQPAWEDLEDAANYLAKGSDSYAASFVQSVKTTAVSLTEFAERGQVVPELGDPSIRELLVRPYRLVYQVTANRVFILALLHGAARDRR